LAHAGEDRRRVPRRLFHFRRSRPGRRARLYISIVGRAKDLIISGGYNVYPAEVEAALDELPQVHESAVVAVPHRELGEAPVAVVVPRDKDFADADAIRAGIVDRLARYKQPRAIVFVDALPKNAMGKVQKTQLREDYKDVLA
jgi:malonyl-CoA/methylmalonyl-CoA synthetase